jgi:hypothetical protein
LISEFVQQLFIHLQDTSKFAGFSDQLFVQLLADFSLSPLLNNLILKYLGLLLHFANQVLLVSECLFLTVVFIEQLLFDFLVHVVLSLLDLVLQVLFIGLGLLREVLQLGLLLLLLYKGID